MRKLLASLFLLITLGMSQGANAGPFEDGRAAFKRGDYATALRLWRPLAAQGNAQAQSALGRMYEHGIFVYEHGIVVPQDYKEALRLYRLAAAQGNADAQDNLGEMYQNGNNVVRDYVRAHMWFLLSQGDLSSNEVPSFLAFANASNMTAAQIAQAKEMARRCQASSYKQCGEPEIASAVTSAPKSIGSTVLIPMKKQGGTYVVPVIINNTLTLDFTVDSGASDVSIPEDVVRTLVRTGTIKDTDFTGEQTYVLADGSKVKSKTFRIRSLKVGDRVLENVLGSVSSMNGSLLLGQSFLGRFKSWSIDNSRHALVLE